MRWEKFYREEISLKRFLELTDLHRPFTDRIINYSWHDKQRRLLEVGVGTGVLSIYLSFQGFNVTAIDNNSDVLERAAQLNARLGGGCKFCEMDMFRLDYTEGSFDTVFHQGVLEHYDEETIKKAISEQLRAGKRVIFSVPSEKYGVHDFGDENLWPFKRWKHLLKSFRVIDAFGYHLVPRGRLHRRLDYFLFGMARLVSERFWDKQNIPHARQIGFVLEQKT